MLKYEVLKNEEFKGLEVYFENRPNKNILDYLKSNGFKWHTIKKCWFAKDNEKNQKVINGLNGEHKEETKTKKEFLFDVKVGDIFYDSWGYEQTNLTFFKVVSLVGSKSVRVVEVQLEETKEDTQGYSMARMVTFNPSKSYVLKKSTFIKDQINGDLFRLKEYGNGEACFKVESFLIASPYKGGELYESWYY